MRLASMLSQWSLVWASLSVTFPFKETSKERKYGQSFEQCCGLIYLLNVFDNKKLHLAVFYLLWYFNPAQICLLNSKAIQI